MCIQRELFTLEIHAASGTFRSYSNIHEFTWPAGALLLCQLPVHVLKHCGAHITYTCM